MIGWKHFGCVFAKVRTPDERRRKERAVARHIASMLIFRNAAEWPFVCSRWEEDKKNERSFANVVLGPRNRKWIG